MKTVYVLLFNGYSDWEIAYLMPELKKSRDFVLKTFTIDGNPVTSVGGLNVSPDTSLQELYANGDLAAIILAGGEAWEKNEIPSIDELVRKAADENKIVAAICAATTYLGKLGLLDNIKHTSNDLNYLKYYVPEYKGENNYQPAFAVTDKNIILQPPGYARGSPLFPVNGYLQKPGDPRPTLWWCLLAKGWECHRRKQLRQIQALPASRILLCHL
jgi:putative intracellular protease/amidase